MSLSPRPFYLFVVAGGYPELCLDPIPPAAAPCDRLVWLNSIALSLRPRPQWQIGPEGRASESESGFDVVTVTTPAILPILSFRAPQA